MILIPIGHEELSIRRLPWVTIGIAIICGLIQIYATVIEFQLEPARAPVRDRLVDLYEQLARDCERRSDCYLGSDPGASIREAVKEERVGTPAQRYAFQTVLNEYEGVMSIHPVHRWGFRPAAPSIPALFTSLFVHGGFAHLIGNMLFLYIVGISLEDRWGRLPFLIMYIVGGVVATSSYAALHAGSSMPLVGASGAISAVMGAFLVLFTFTQIRFFYFFIIFFIFRTGTFGAPAWVVIPLWFLEQLLSLSLEMSGEDNVAYSAHAGGFVFGLAVAIGFKLSGLEAQFTRAADVAAGDWYEEPALTTARDALAQHIPRAALRALGPFLEKEPDHLEAHVLMVDTAEQLSNYRLMQRHALAAIKRWMQSDQPAAVVDAYQRLDRLSPDPMMTDILTYGLDAALYTNNLEAATSMARRLALHSPRDPSLPKSMFVIGALYMRMGLREQAQGIFQRLQRQHPNGPWAARSYELLRRA